MLVIRPVESHGTTKFFEFTPPANMHRYVDPIINIINFAFKIVFFMDSYNEDLKWILQPAIKEVLSGYRTWKPHTGL